MNNILYICGRVGRIDPLLKEETRTPFPTTFCSGLQKTGKMKLIPLTQGLFAQVDNRNYDWLMQWNWFAHKNRGTYYAERWGREGDKRIMIRMHRVIMNTPENMVVDHRDHNGLNCLEENMRNCSDLQNRRNRKAWGNSKYLGVTIIKSGNRNGRITATISVNGKKTHLAVCKTEIEAAMIYDVKAKEVYGEFANLNFKD